MSKIKFSILQHQCPLAVKYHPKFHAQYKRTSCPPLWEFVLVSLLCPNNRVKFDHSLTQCDICGKRNISAHCQICRISHKRCVLPQPCTSATFMVLQINCKHTPSPQISTNAPQCKDTIDFLSRLLAKSNNLIKYIFALSECYENCQLLQPVNKFVEPVTPIQPNDADRRQFAIPLTPSSSSSILSHSVYHIQTFHFALQLYELFSCITLSLSALCGPLVMCWECDRMW